MAAEFAIEGSAIARVVIDAAKDGNINACALVLQRISPPLRPTPAKVHFELNPDAPIAEQAKQVVLALSRGEIDADTAKLIMDLLSAYVGLRDVETFVAELRRLHGNHKQPAIAGGVLTQ